MTTGVAHKIDEKNLDITSNNLSGS